MLRSWVVLFVSTTLVLVHPATTIRLVVVGAAEVSTVEDVEADVVEVDSIEVDVVEAAEVSTVDVGGAVEPRLTAEAWASSKAKR